MVEKTEEPTPERQLIDAIDVGGVQVTDSERKPLASYNASGHVYELYPGRVEIWEGKGGDRLHTTYLAREDFGGLRRLFATQDSGATATVEPETSTELRAIQSKDLADFISRYGFHNMGILSFSADLEAENAEVQVQVTDKTGRVLIDSEGDAVKTFLEVPFI